MIIDDGGYRPVKKPTCRNGRHRSSSPSTTTYQPPYIIHDQDLVHCWLASSIATVMAMAIPECVNQRSRSPSFKLSALAGSSARARTLEVQAEKLRERLEGISPPRWKSREELYAMAILEPDDRHGVRTSPITPTPPSVLSPSPRPSIYQPSLYAHISTLSPHTTYSLSPHTDESRSPRTTQSPSPPTSRSLSLDTISLTSVEDVITNIPKFTSTQSQRKDMTSSRSATPPSELPQSLLVDNCVNRRRIPFYHRSPRSHSDRTIRRGPKYRIMKLSSHSMITRSKLRRGLR